MLFFSIIHYKPGATERERERERETASGDVEMIYFGVTWNYTSRVCVKFLTRLNLTKYEKWI